MAEYCPIPNFTTARICILCELIFWTLPIVLWWDHIVVVNSTLETTCEVGVLTIPILQMRKQAENLNNSVSQLITGSLDLNWIWVIWLETPYSHKYVVRLEGAWGYSVFRNSVWLFITDNNVLNLSMHKFSFLPGKKSHEQNPRCYGLNCICWKLCVEALTPNSRECGLISEASLLM